MLAATLCLLCVIVFRTGRPTTTSTGSTTNTFAADDAFAFWLAFAQQRGPKNGPRPPHEERGGDQTRN